MNSRHVKKHKPNTDKNKKQIKPIESNFRKCPVANHKFPSSDQHQLPSPEVCITASKSIHQNLLSPLQT